MKEDIPQIGMTYQILKEKGIKDLRTIAKEYHNQQGQLAESSLWAHDRFLEFSSDGSANVITPSDGSSKICTVWSINHYLGLNRHPYVKKKAKEAIDIYGTGCGTSAMSGGTLSTS